MTLGSIISGCSPVYVLRAAYEDVRVWHMGITLAAMDLGLDLVAAQIEIEKGRIVLSGTNDASRIIPVDREIGRAHV